MKISCNSMNDKTNEILLIDIHQIKTLYIRRFLLPNNVQLISSLLLPYIMFPFHCILFTLFSHLQIMILQEVNGRVASNRSISWEHNHLLMSNLEPRQSYYIKIAAFTSKGIGPFSEVLHVR